MTDRKNFIESLARGFSVLECISSSKSGLGLTEISHQTVLNKSTIQRITSTLHQLGYIQRNGETKKFAVGQKALSFSLSVVKNLDLRNISAPYLKDASKATEETVNLAILRGTEIVYVERIKTKQIININLDIGSKLPVYCTSMGKCLLAFLPEYRLSKILASIEFRPFTPKTIKSRNELIEELKKVKKNGFSVNDEELAIGLRSVSAPVRDYTGDVVAAVNIAVPSVRVSAARLKSDFAKIVVKTADSISRALGFSMERNA
jgi:IclR family pca regulon transcriptional regulator